MTQKESTRRKFLKFLGLSTTASLVGTKGLAGIIKQDDIRQLNPKQKEFMERYGLWMDEFIEVIRVQKKDAGNPENNKKMISLTERAEHFKPELAEFMKDETFSLIYKASIERMSKEI